MSESIQKPEGVVASAKVLTTSDAKNGKSNGVGYIFLDSSRFSLIRLSRYHKLAPPLAFHLLSQAGLLCIYYQQALYWHSTDREIALMILMAYASYMLAELFNLSAILTVFFCGIVLSHYTLHNFTESSRVTTNPGTLIGVSSVLLVLILVGRATSVFPLSFLSNLTKLANEKIHIKKQITIWWVGLMHGAVSMALAYS